MEEAGRDPNAGTRGMLGRGFFAGLRIRKKLMLLHTVFSIASAVILLIAVQPAVRGVIAGAEMDQAGLALSQRVASDLLRDETTGDVTIRVGGESSIGLPEDAAEAARAQPGRPYEFRAPRGGSAAVWVPDGDGTGRFALATAHSEEARRAVTSLYGLVVLAVLLAYGLIAAALEVFVLPQHVYGPIRRLLRADRAVREGDPEHELIEEGIISADELGEIMRSRNESIRSLRRHEGALADAVGQLEHVAADLKRKNHLLETARRNLADADRLASLGMMSAGLAHELNTPLAVVKGLAEKLESSGELSPSERGLLVRVVRRLEGLGESLLDFARVRPPESRPAALAKLIEDAWTLVRLDREASDVEFRSEVSESAVVWCDADRMVQVFVNLLRNAVDAMHEDEGEGPRSLTARMEETSKDGARWASISIEDTGPGIPPDVLSTLFEPFVSTRLDARGTGLGLAVAEGIVREHGGLLVARNRPEGRGAVFEILLPLEAAIEAPPSVDGDPEFEVER